MLTNEEKRHLLRLTDDQWGKFKNCYGELTTKILDHLLSLQNTDYKLAHLLKIGALDMDKDEKILKLEALNEELTKMLGRIVIFGSFYPSAIELDQGIDGEQLGKEARALLHRALDFNTD